jgi:hypothetical protein
VTLLAKLVQDVDLVSIFAKLAQYENETSKSVFGFNIILALPGLHYPRQFGAVLRARPQDQSGNRRAQLGVSSTGFCPCLQVARPCFW